MLSGPRPNHLGYVAASTVFGVIAWGSLGCSVAKVNSLSPHAEKVYGLFLATFGGFAWNTMTQHLGLMHCLNELRAFTALSGMAALLAFPQLFPDISGAWSTFIGELRYLTT